MNHSHWICCQLGAREHYAIPRALHQAGALSLLVTDAWVSPQSFLNQIPSSALRSLRDRHHPDLTDAPITAFTTSLLRFELTHRLRQTADWDRMMARNHWFQARTLQTLRHWAAKRSVSAPPTLFTYSYAALDLFRFAKRLGWRTILGQIDPGRLEEKIVGQAQQNHPDLAPNWQPVPPEYWQSWQQECALADQIVVNSDWSKQLLLQAGVNSEKIHIVPLVYAPPPAAQNFVRHYPQQFSPDRPLRVLFLGLVTLRKGIAACLDAIGQLTGQPIEFWMVGPQQIEIPPPLQSHPQVRWLGAVPRSQTAWYYQQADVFLFPTLSDGFGLTQLEAQAWQLPIIASQHCGAVVQPGINGIVLDTVTGTEIAQQLLTLKSHPESLQQLSQQSIQFDGFDLPQLAHQLQTLT